MAVPSIRPQHRRMSRTFHAVPAALVLAVLGACASAPAGTPVTVQLRELNGSGVSGTVTMNAIDGGHTLVEVAVEAAGHPNMPAHIHPGTCAELVPQPTYALQSVIAGRSSTTVEASLEELLSGGQALNIHMSNDEMGVYSSCGDLS